MRGKNDGGAKGRSTFSRNEVVARLRAGAMGSELQHAAWLMPGQISRCQASPSATLDQRAQRWIAIALHVSAHITPQWMIGA